MSFELEREAGRRREEASFLSPHPAPRGGWKGLEEHGLDVAWKEEVLP